MLKLSNQTKNTEDLAWGIFERRWGKQVHFIDWERFYQLSGPFKGGRYLDVGCFNSPMPFYLSKEFPSSDIHALDHCKRLVEELQNRFPSVNYKYGKADNLPYVDGYFDYVVAGEVIEHMDDPQKLVDECFRVLRSGGKLALSTPYEEIISQPPVSSEHQWAFTVEDIKQLLSRHSATVETKIYKDSVPVIIAYATKR